jgi:hypothetical protein
MRDLRGKYGDSLIVGGLAHPHPGEMRKKSKSRARMEARTSIRPTASTEARTSPSWVHKILARREASVKKSKRERRNVDA